MNTFGKYILYVLSVLFLGSCNNERQEQTDKIVAKVFNKNLTLSELKAELPASATSVDSIRYAKDYIDKWIKQQLLVSEAEKRLTADELRIEREIENYRQELIIYKYKNKRFQEILALEIPDKEIHRFYIQHIDNFTLNEPIARVSYIIFPLELNIPDNIYASLVSKRPSDIEIYEDFVFRFAKKYDNFENQWIYLSRLLQQINYQIDPLDPFLKKNKIIETKRNNERHIILINEYFSTGQHAPIEFVNAQIRGTIINQKKLDFLREFKDSLYNNALKYNKFRVFNQ